MVQVQIYATSIAMAHHPVKYDTVLWKKKKICQFKCHVFLKSIQKDCAAKSHVNLTTQCYARFFGNPSLRAVLQKAA